MQIFPATAILLYFASSYASLLAYKLIRLHLSIVNNLNLKPEQLFSHVLDLKQKHLYVCEMVDQINDCFGWMLAATLSFQFVAIVNSSFYIFGVLQADVQFTSVLTFLTHVLQLLIVCVIADPIREQVKKRAYCCTRSNNTNLVT